MENNKYKLGYDMMGRVIVIDDKGRFITHIPTNTTADEVLSRLNKGEVISFDARNPYLEKDIPIEVAPPELWPLFYAWQENCKEKPEDPRTFEEFANDFTKVYLTVEEEEHIIELWKSYQTTDSAPKYTFEEFRKKCIKLIYKVDPEILTR